ncbi:ATP-binding protein [Geomonas sp. RF6]|uniref:cache domain-containing protein n=1 Tax=Geomonas sp. RF6 TaxID=2897342 RepID=UPI001E5CA5D4|nr:cache domain-containing protein [Geomonas sp. RF6]UFS69319.1 ATP-binding protein [Geomonas sp. RF6]
MIETRHPEKEWLYRLLRGGIRYRLFLLVFLIMLPFAALLGYMYYERYEIRRTHALQSELEVARGLAVSFSNYLNGIRKQSVALGHAIISTPGSEETITATLLTGTARLSPGVRNICWLSPEGVVQASSEKTLVGRDLSDRASFRKAITGSDLAISDIAPTGAVTARPTLTVSVPIRDNAGRLAGVVMTAIEPARLKEFALTQKRPEGGALAVFDTRGVLVFHSLLQNPTWEERVSWKRGDKILSRALVTQKEQAGIQRITHLQNSKWVSARVPIPPIGWIVGAGHPVDIAFEEVRTGMIGDALLGTAVFLLAFCVAALLGRSISRPLLALERDALLMGEGSTVTVEDPLAPVEVQKLRESLVDMSGALLRRSRELQESEISLRTVFDNVYDGIVIHDEMGRIIDVNKRWLEMMRVSRDQVPTLTIADASAHPPPLMELTPMWRRVLSGETMMFEWAARRPGDGAEFDSEIFLCSIRFNGKDLVMANIRDISERKRIAAELQRSRDELEIRVQERTADLARAFADLEAETELRVAAVEELRVKEQLVIQQSRLAAMGEMMGKIAHHWRQPLNVIGLMVQDMLLSAQVETLTVQEIEESTDRIMSILDRLSKSIDDFQNLFSPDTRKSVFWAQEVVETALSLLRADLEDIEVQVEDNCQRGCTVDGFRNQYLQVVLNIITNARETLQDRKVADPAIRITIAREGERTVVSISDNGGGINAEIRERIFDPYFSTKAPEKATGIGLFMAKTIIEKNMGGTLTARNRNSGAEFSIVV